MEQIQWSFSSLKDFIGCPKRYQEVKVLKNYEFQPTAATTYGNKVHAALEAYVKDGAELPANYKQISRLCRWLLLTYRVRSLLNITWL
jgi:hypothetical protein